jgi:hypothetical protein
MADYTYIGWECYVRNTVPRGNTVWVDWEATHPLYDGAPDSPTRGHYVTAPTLAELKVAIELWERENGLNVIDEVGVEEYYNEANQPMPFTDEELWQQKGNW